MCNYEIINKLATEKTVEKLSIKYLTYIPQKLRKDFNQFVYLILLEMNPQIITTLHNTGELIYFIKYLIRLNAISKTSQFNQKILKLFKEVEMDELIESQVSSSNVIIDEEIILLLYNNLSIAEKYILDLLDTHTQKEVGDILKTSQAWISEIKKRTKNKIKNKYDNI